MDRNHLFQTEQQANQLSSRTNLTEKLDHYYQLVSLIILAKQHPATGLLPASTAVTTHGDYRDAWVRDNVYSILCVFGLALAYKRLGDDGGKAYELEHSVVKLMRGLLFSMMRQAHKVELFKNKQSVDNALHAKYSTTTGDIVVGDKEWGHLQLDATSLFLLMLAEMTASGLRIVFTLDEVDFVQNLVFYLERAYRTPDYGIWERGNKMNHGTPELNSSSIGTAVAALQAINGINLFGSTGGPASVVHVLPDEITRNYTTLHSALPRESNSKEIDAALMGVISYPSFAIHNPKLIARTRNEIVAKLQGKYGCKRFLRDGHQTQVEDTTRLHYEPHELQVFEDIECEWPLFYTYLILEGLFNRDFEQVEFYRAAIQRCLVDSSVLREGTEEDEELHSENISPLSFRPAEKLYHPQIPPGVPLIPELFVVPRDSISAEKKTPHSQVREPNENIPLVWAQSLYILGELMYDGLLAPDEIDPLGRHRLPMSRGEHKMDTVVQIVLIAEDAELQAKLATFGLETQTPDQVTPITVSAPGCLREAYGALGANEKLGLTGRPKRPVGTLATCKLYRVAGRMYAFTPHFMDKEEFYMTMDNDYLVSLFENELRFVSHHWWYTGRPTMVVYLTNAMMGPLRVSKVNGGVYHGGGNFKESQTESHGFVSRTKKRTILNFMMSLRSGTCGGVRIRLGRLQEMVSTSCIESLDFLTIKLDKGYLRRGNTKSTYQQILIGLKDQSKVDTKLLLTPTDAHARVWEADYLTSVVQKVESDTSPFLSPVDIGVSPGLSKSRSSERLREELPNRSESTSPSKGKEATDYKLKSTPNIERLDIISPLHITRKASALSGLESKERDKLIIRRNGTDLAIYLGDSLHLFEAIDYLLTSNNIRDQIELLHYVYSCKGLNYLVNLKEAGTASVRDLLEEVYQKAAQMKQWSIVRQAAGILKKVVNSLTINLTDLLIRQKQVTIGVGSKEYTVSSPLGPEALVEVINSHCRSDTRESPLMQEILIYLGTYIRSDRHLFDGIIRVRAHYIVIAMREEISRIRNCDQQGALEFMMSLSPFEIKSLLGYVLSAREKTKSLPTGSNRVPGKSVLKIQSGGFSDGNFATIEMNDELVTHQGDRGLNVIIVNTDQGNLLEYSQFDSHISNEEANEFARLIESLEPGTVVAVICKDDCFEQLTEAARLACESIGSDKIRSLGYRDSWCIIGCKGARSGTVPESLQKSKHGPSHILEQSFDDMNSLSALAELSNGTAQLPSKGFWLRRRKIDGALQRTPNGFYPKVHRILEKSVSGIVVNGLVLPRNPTISEKTPEEINFAIQVEWLLSGIQDPAERQIAVECLVLISQIEKRNPEVRLGGGNALVDLMTIVRKAYVLFWDDWLAKHKAAEQKAREDARDGKEDRDSAPEFAIVIQESTFEANEHLAKKMFYDLPQEGSDGTTSFLAKAALAVLPYEINISGQGQQPDLKPTANTDDEGGGGHADCRLM